MYDVSKKLGYLRNMQKGKIPEEYRHDGQGKKYKTTYEKYQAIHKLLSECEEEERDCIEVTLTASVASWKDVKNFTGCISVFLSSAALIISAASVCFDALLKNKTDDFVIGMLGTVVASAMGIAIVAIVLYYVLDALPGGIVKRDKVILGILEKVKEKPRTEKDAEVEILDTKESRKTYCITICEKQE